MQYQRSLDIEQRLETVLRLVRTGAYSTPRIAKALDISIPTVSRDVTALRERGHAIRAVRNADGWRFVLRKSAGRTRQSTTDRLNRSSPGSTGGGRA